MLRKAAFYAGYGLLPLWAAIAIVVVGSWYSDSHEYWNVAPWLIVVAIPACALTFGIATLTLVVHARAGGEPSRRKTVAVGCFGVLNLLLVAAAGLWWMQTTRLKQEIETEKTRALDFVRSHATVVERFGAGLDVSIVTYATSSNERMPHRYEVSIDTKQPQGAEPGPQYVYAIVGVWETAGERELVLDCITPTYMGQRDSSKGPCEQ